MKKIFIDIGHGDPKKNGGASYKGRTEAADVIRLSHRVGDLLKEQGVDVRFSRADNEDPDLSVRCRNANEWSADYFVSVHRNACSPNVARGVEAYVYHNCNTSGNTYKYAKSIVDNLCRDCNFINRGTKLGYTGNPKADYQVNRETKMDSCLLEVGFVDSDTDNNIFDTRFETMALSIAKSLCAIVGITYMPKSENKQETAKTTVKNEYEVCVGGAVSKVVAEIIADRLRKAGEDCVYIRKIGDVNLDGKVSVEDAREILRKATGLE